MLDLNTLYRKFVDLEYHNQLPKKWEKEYRLYFIRQYKLYGNSARGFAKKNFLRDKIKQEYSEEWEYFVNYIKNKYEVDGVGLKLLAKSIGISYTKMRRLMEYSMNIPIRKGNNVITEHLRKVRSVNAKRAGGWRNRKTKNKNTERGVQGYFYNSSKNKYVWLRSTYEVILAKWLNNNSIEWDVECKQWMIGKESYRPDFFIYENDILVKIIEVKGYFKNRVWKFEELKKIKELENIEFCLIDDIKPFLNGSTYLGELQWWKQNRLLELK
jgi:hypothetical protein